MSAVEAASRQPPERRESYLRLMCRGDDELFREILEQLNWQQRMGNFLLQPLVMLSTFDGPLEPGEAMSGKLVGTQLGPYKIEGLLGLGGMGAVYRAVDSRLGRQVAIKVSAERFGDRFEREGRAIAALNHPHICTLYDVGPNYIVMELIEGETLAGRLSKRPLPLGLVVRYGAQIAEALAEAHGKGIVHRDLKPGNIMLTKNGVKVLDFGLAKSVGDEVLTAPDMVAGTPAYMAPEQREGLNCDARTDIYMLGLVLYEMASGKRPLPNETPATDALPVQFAHVVGRCLAHDAADRWQAASDVKVELEWAGAGSHQPVIGAAPGWRFSRWALAGVLATIAVIAFLVGRHTSSVPVPKFYQLTFRRGNIMSARFAPDGNTIIYGAAWEDDSMQVFAARLDSAGSRPLGLPAGDVLALSSSGELALSLGRQYGGDGWNTSGKLARAPLAGGPPRDVLDEAQDADWEPGGSRLAVVRQVGGKYHLEFPIGKTLFETQSWISHPRFSPHGDRIAFLEHPAYGDDGGRVNVVDLAGRKTSLTPMFASAQGLAWLPDASEIWYTAADLGYERHLRAVTPAGRDRLVASIPGTLTLHDISRQGRLLVTHERIRQGAAALVPGESKERDLTWLDGTMALDISADGKTVLLSEQGTGAGPDYTVFLRRTGVAEPVRLGDGLGLALSPDGKWAATILRDQIVLLPTGAGEPRLIPKGGVTPSEQIAWLHGGGIVFRGAEKGQGLRAYAQGLGGTPRAITPELAPGHQIAISPDDKWLAAPSSEGAVMYPITGGAPRPVRGAKPGDAVIQWSQDGASLYLATYGKPPARVFRLDLATSRRQLWKTIMPQDPVGIGAISPILITPDGKTFVYNYFRVSSDLYVVDGWK